MLSLPRRASVGVESDNGNIRIPIGQSEIADNCEPQLAYAQDNTDNYALGIAMTKNHLGSDRPAQTTKIEITPEMVEAGESVILERVGGADLGGFFSAAELAIEVYQAMVSSSGKCPA
jgi:hypothetical protein